MPLYDNVCHPCRRKFEWLAKSHESTDPRCPDCDGPTERLVGAPNVIWTKPISEYGNKNAETYQKDLKNGGHWTFEKNSDAAQLAGKPLPVFIRNEKDNADYCRREKLINPKDLPSNLKVSAGGDSYETANRSEV